MRLTLLIWATLVASTIWAQNDIPIGTWRSHLSYRVGTGVAESPQNIYCLTDQGLFFFDKGEASLTKITTIDGLAGGATATIGYSVDQQSLLMTYQDGNIDIISQNVITNFDLLKNSSLMGEKGVTHISFDSNIAFLSSQLGLIVFDMTKVEIKEAYTNLGEEGEELAIEASAVLLDSLYLATPEGLIVASLSDEVNRLDYRNWVRPKMPDGSSAPTTAVVAFDSRIYTASGSDLYSYLNGTFEKITLPTQEPIRWLQVSSNQMTITQETQVLIMTPEMDFTVITDPLIVGPAMSLIDESENLWIADQQNSLISNREAGFRSYFPDGPFSNQIFALNLLGQEVAALPGGYDNNRFPFRNDDGFFLFQGGEWVNYNSSGLVGSLPLPPAQDLVFATSTSIGTQYIASFGWGLLAGDESGWEVIDESTQGSPLMNANPPGRNTQITAAVADLRDNIWVANYAVSPSVHVLSPGGGWDSFATRNDRGRFPLGLLVLSNGDIWLRISPERGGGLLVFNPQSGQERLLGTSSGSGGLPSNTVNDMQIDLNGQLWVATDNGVAFYPNPLFVLTDDLVDATLPVFDSQFLLRGQRVTSLRVDGGNRKWMGTEDGVWLFEDSGEEVVFRFTPENSPLLSERIVDIEIEPRSGEVFFGTDQGLISFRGTATESEPVHQQVKIFPNPVTPDFTGLVGISGLATGAVVKITDASGKLVKEILAEGGTATWDTFDLSGNRVASGVYMVFSSTRDGKDTFIGKIAVIN